MLCLGGHFERHDGQGSVHEADAESDEEPADESDPHGDRGQQERSDGDRADRHQRTAEDREPVSQMRIVNACLADRANRPGDRTEGDPPCGGGLGPPVHALQDQRNHDGETDL